MTDPNPAAAARTKVVTLPCHWYEDSDGGRWLIPGCIARALNPDTDCTCSTLALDLEAALADLDKAQSRAQSTSAWASALLAAITEHADSSAITARAMSIQKASKEVVSRA